MKAKLIKEVDFYGLKIEGKIIGLSNNSTNNLFNYPFKLSLKNCEAIANDYDLDEIIEQTKLTLEDSRISSYDSFRIGMETILEILGDKKFSEEDVRKASVDAFQKCYEVINSGKFYDITSAIEWLTQTNSDNYIQSLKQTEWDVEIVMRPASLVYKSNLVIEELDADGCLILKRI